MSLSTRMDISVTEPTIDSHPTPTATPQGEPLSFIRRRPVRLAIYTGLGLFVVAMLAAHLVPPLLDPTFEKHIQEHRVMVGMTREQVLEAWGSPNTMHVTHTKDGLRREEWIFEDWESTAVVKHRYLYFEEGTLIAGWFKGSDVRIPTKPPSGMPNPHRRPETAPPK